MNQKLVRIVALGLAALMVLGIFIGVINII